MIFIWIQKALYFEGELIYRSISHFTLRLFLVFWELELRSEVWAQPLPSLECEGLQNVVGKSQTGGK